MKDFTARRAFFPLSQAYIVSVTGNVVFHTGRVEIPISHGWFSFLTFHPMAAGKQSWCYPRNNGWFLEPLLTGARNSEDMREVLSCTPAVPS